MAKFKQYNYWSSIWNQADTINIQNNINSWIDKLIEKIQGEEIENKEELIKKLQEYKNTRDNEILTNIFTIIWWSSSLMQLLLSIIW